MWSLLLLIVPCGVHASLSDYFRALSFKATDPPAHMTSIATGVYFEHLYKVNSKEHTFDSDFWLVYRWHDGRNFSSIFYDKAGYLHHHVETETTTCVGADVAAGSHLRRLAAPSSSPRHFVELSHSDLNALWQPDLHLRNAHGKEKVNAELIRLYEDGVVERLALTFAVLELYHPFYGSYPFDTQHLSVIVESMAHTTLQIQQTKLKDFIGLEMAATLEWPGFTLKGSVADSLHAKVLNVTPDYTHTSANSHRCERRARLHFDVTVGRDLRNIITSQFLPLIILIAVTWTAFFISIKSLMPRIAVGFISFLTLSNMAASFTAGLPAVSYDTWLNVFFTAHRLFVVISLFETATNVWVTEHLSTRVGLGIDRYARVVIPVDYVLVVVVLFATGPSYELSNGEYEERLKLVSAFVFVNAAFMFVAMPLYVLLSYQWLKRNLKTNPLVMHYGAIDHKPLDSKELRVVFSALDADGNGVLSIDELIENLMLTDPKLKVDEATRQQLKDRLSKKSKAIQHLTLSKFIASYGAIFDELDVEIRLLRAAKASADSTVVDAV